MAIKQILGTASNDLLTATLEAESFDGLAGRDTVSYANSTSAVKVDLATGKGSGGFAAGDLFAGIEAITGSKGNDTLLGAAFAETLSGGEGNDLLYGSLGADRLDGGAGIDKVTYSGSTAAVKVDLPTGKGSGGDAAGDTLVSIEQVNGSKYNDTLLGGGGAETLAGLDGNDLLYGSLGADRLDGGAGIDKVTYSGSTAAVKVDLSTGKGSGGYAAGDTLVSIEQVNGSAYGDTLLGGTGTETLSGLDGSDLLYGSPGADKLDGGADTDKVTYSGSTAAVKVDLATGKGTGGYAAGDVLTGIEQVNGSKYNDTLLGGGGAETLSGMEGNDLLYGSAGADRLDGGVGFDTVSYSQSTSAVKVDLGTRLVSGGYAAGDLLVSIEAAIGSQYDDTLIGGSRADFLDGGAGNDSLYGGERDDILSGGAGADYLNGGSGFDWADYSSAGSGMYLTLKSGVSMTGDAAGDTLEYIEGIIGSAYSDTMLAGDNSGILRGGGGDDWFYGGRGSDTLNGEAGNDSVYGSFGDDSLSGGDGSDTLAGGTGSDTLRGGSGNDILNGNEHNDVLYGDEGNDTLIGYEGDDTMTGGGGADRFEFDYGPHKGDMRSVDTILDFSRTQGDKIALLNRQNTQVGVQQGAALGDSASGVFGTKGALIVQAGQHSYLYVDINGDKNYVKAEDHAILLPGASGLNSTDIKFESTP